MQYQREGMPEEDELVVCTVTSVQYNSVFCTLDEFHDKSAMIHISEVTAGRIRNIREYVMEGKKVVCKVLRIDKEKGHVDLSLRRVNDRQRREKLDMLKQEMKAEHLISQLAGEMKKPADQLYKEIFPAVQAHYPFLYQAFNAVVDGTFSMEKTSLGKEMAKKLDVLIKEKIKPKQVQVAGVFAITTYAEHGLADVKDALIKARTASGGADLRYLGAGQYKIIVTAEEYKDAEKSLQAAQDAVTERLKKVPSTTVEFTRIEVEH